MARKKNLKGYINHSIATPKHLKDKQNKVYGKYFSTIDFSPNSDINENNFKDKSVPIGTLSISNKELELTEYEINKIINTLENALSIHTKKIALGL
jgi:hypothetical protein